MSATTPEDTAVRWIFATIDTGVGVLLAILGIALLMVEAHRILGIIIITGSLFVGSPGFGFGLYGFGIFAGILGGLLALLWSPPSNVQSISNSPVRYCLAGALISVIWGVWSFFGLGPGWWFVAALVLSSFILGCCLKFYKTGTNQTLSGSLIVISSIAIVLLMIEPDFVVLYDNGNLVAWLQSILLDPFSFRYLLFSVGPVLAVLGGILLIRRKATLIPAKHSETMSGLS